MRFEKTFRIAEKIILPILATTIIIDFWDSLNKFMVVLVVLYLLLGILEKIGVNIKFLERLKKTKFGKMFIRLIRSSNPVVSYTEEHLEETSEIIAQGLIEGSKQVKKIKEEIKVKKRYNAIKLFISHNKRIIIGFVLGILMILETQFHWATDLGIPIDWLPYIAVGIVIFIGYCMGIEGFTFNDINQIRFDARQSIKDIESSLKTSRKEKAKKMKRYNELKNMFKNGIPAEYAEEYNLLSLQIDKLDQGIELLLDDLEQLKNKMKTK